MTKVGPLLELGHHQEVQLEGVLTFQDLVQLNISLIFGGNYFEQPLFQEIVLPGNQIQVHEDLEGKETAPKCFASTLQMEISD